MAIYTTQAGGNINPGHWNGINQNINLANGGQQVTRITWMAIQAINNYPWNQAPPQTQVGNWAITRGLKMVYTIANNTWQGHVTSGIYRLDFQGYAINNTYANWQVQFGVGHGGNGGAASNVLVKLDHTFSAGQFIHALQHSTQHAATCRLDP